MCHSYRSWSSKERYTFDGPRHIVGNSVLQQPTMPLSLKVVRLLLTKKVWPRHLAKVGQLFQPFGSTDVEIFESKRVTTGISKYAQYQRPKGHDIQ